MTPQPLVSIITPVYNGAEYLSECIESVLAQTYEHWQYTIVDNCSTDASLAIARRYEASDTRIRVRTNREFLPVIANHNEALRHVSFESKYCKVVFADDWIFPECLAKMVAVAEDHPSVGLVGAYCLEGRHVICTGLAYPSHAIDGREICREHLLNRLYLFGSANSVLYRTDTIRERERFYNEANIHADTEVCFKLLKTRDFGFVHQVLTFTRVRAESLTAASADLHTYLPGMFRILMAYGRDYLTDAELAACSDEWLSYYYRFLAKSQFLGRDARFWDYHKKQLSELGLGLKRVRLAQATISNFFAAALCPRDAIAKLMRNRSERRFRPSTDGIA